MQTTMQFSYPNKNFTQLLSDQYYKILAGKRDMQRKTNTSAKRKICNVKPPLYHVKVHNCRIGKNSEEKQHRNQTKREANIAEFSLTYDR